MSRSIWKGPYVSTSLIKSKQTQVWTRNTTIIPSFVSQTLYVHNGQKFQQLFITDNIIGLKLGQFVLTRKSVVHKKKKTKKK